MCGILFGYSSHLFEGNSSERVEEDVGAFLQFWENTGGAHLYHRLADSCSSPQPQLCIQDHFVPDGSHVTSASCAYLLLWF